MKLVLSLIVITIHALDYPQCSLYTCYTPKYKTQCAKTDKNTFTTTYSISTCAEDKLCDFHPEHELSYCIDSLHIRYPGEYCKDKEDCITNHCIKNECVGLRPNDKCTDDSQCGYKLYCNEIQKQCMEVSSVGQPCDERIKCDSGLACDGVRCVLLGSLDIGAPTMFPSACKTLFSENNLCAPGPKLVSEEEVKGPLKCTGKCVYKAADNSTLFETPCVCSKSEKPEYYCNPGIGDIETTDVTL